VKVIIEYGDDDMDAAHDALRAWEYKAAINDMHDEFRKARKYSQDPVIAAHGEWAEEILWETLKERDIVNEL